jgi:hypothetical protein
MITRYRLFVTVTIEGEEPPEGGHVAERVQEVLSTSEAEGGGGLHNTVSCIETEGRIDEDDIVCPRCGDTMGEHELRCSDG